MTIWYGLLLGTTLIVFGVLLSAGLRWRLYTGFDEQLDTQADIVLSTIQFKSDGVAVDFQSTGLSEREFFIRILDPGGATLAEQGQGSSGIPRNQERLAQALQGAKVYRSASLGGEEHLRILSVPIRAPDGSAIVGVLEVGLNRSDLDQTLDELMIALLVLVPVATLIAVIGGYLLSRPVLQPLTRITNLAEHIGEGDLHERLRHDLPDDEVGRLANTFNEMLARIEHAFERQRRFTSDAAHELRTPMSLIRSQVDLALARPRSEGEYVEALRGVDGDLARLTALTAALLSLARLESPEPRPEMLAFDLAETIDALAATYEATMASAGIELRLGLEAIDVTADEDLIIQVLVNLLDNAMTATGRGGTITVGCRPVGDEAEIRVSDTGPGIPVEDLPRIFDRFYRPDSGRTRARGGAGLGLAICKAIVEAHHGTIEIVSAVGEGTTVVIRLPLRPARMAGQSPPSSIG
jgi:heavy metal sensor kinase